MKIFQEAIAQKVSGEVSRRALLTSGLAGGFLLAFHLPLRALTPNEPVQPPDDTNGKFAPNAFIRIDQAGHTTLVMPQVEMGQGIYTGVAMILAEELDADFSSVILEHAPPNEKLYANPAFGIQATGGSTSVRVFWKPLRAAGATARAMLVQAAAQQWQVEPASCTTANGVVTHPPSGRQLSFGVLAASATGKTPPKEAPLKDPKDFVLIGKPLKRLDTPDKVNGKVVYGIDAILPGMKFATVAACPVFGGKVGKVDDSDAKKIPGVQKIVVLDDMVAVVGDHMWAAKKGLDALVIDWNEGPNARISSKDIWQDLRAASEKDGAVAKSEGDITKGLATGDRLDASYELPFLAHAPMEPLNATVHVKADSCEIWTGTQIMARVQSEAAKAAGLPVEKVTVNNHLIGGGFGPNNNVSAIESFMDEPPRKAGKDPFEFRRGMLGKNPRLLAALDLVAEKSGWGQPLAARVGRGVSVQPSFGSFIATVVEAEVDEQGEVHLRRVTSAVDTGIAVNPDTIMAQLEGGLIFGLTAALYGEVTIEKGRVQQSNFHDYRMLRIDQAPKIDVHVIKSGEAPGGIGETGVTAGPPALRNAIYAATGVALRRLPIDRALIAAEKKT